MTEPIPSELLALEQEYPVRVSRDHGQVVIRADSLDADFWLDVYTDGSCIFGSDGWHEHAGSMTETAEFMRRLFAGTVQFEIVYRGDKPVGHRRLERGPDGMAPANMTTGCFSPFWKPKSRRIVSYCLLTSVST